MKKFVAASAIILASASFAAADEVSFSDSFGFPLSPGSQTLNLPRFDTMGGTRVLKAVHLDLNATVSAQITVENDSAIPAVVGVSVTGIIDATGPAGLSTTAGIVSSIAGVPLSASDGVPGSGPDFTDFGFLSASDTDTDSFAGPGFASFIAPGTVPILVNASAGYAATGTTDSTLTASNFRASGTATIRYVFNVVPAPAAAAFLPVLGGLAAARRRRA